MDAHRQLGTRGIFLRLFCMTKRQERFRAKAMECYVAAQKAKDRQARNTFLELTSGWRELAGYVEGIENQHNSIKNDQVASAPDQRKMDHQRQR